MNLDFTLLAILRALVAVIALTSSILIIVIIIQLMRGREHDTI